MTFSDEQQMLIEARRDPAAFRVLYLRYLPRVYAYVAYRVGREADAEDLTADIFINVVEGLKGFEDRGEGAFAAWLFRIAHNRVSQFYRQQGQPAVSLDDLPDIASESPTPEDTLPTAGTIQPPAPAHRQLIPATAGDLDAAVLWRTAEHRNCRGAGVGRAHGRRPPLPRH